MEDTGMYGCTAGNTGGLKRTEVYLHVASEFSIDVQLVAPYN